MAKPWEVSPSLTESRLRLIAETIARVRSEVVEAHEPEKGDGPWGFGCRAYERTCFALSNLALQIGCRDWLKVDAQRLECTLYIGDIAIKFYRGEPDDPTPRALRGGFRVAMRDARVGQSQLFGLFDVANEAETDSVTWIWLLAIETHSDGSVARVIALQATEVGDVRNVWEIPTDAAVVTLTQVVQMQREGVDLPPPVVGPKVIEKNETGTDSAGGSDDQGDSNS